MRSVDRAGEVLLRIEAADAEARGDADPGSPVARECGIEDLKDRVLCREEPVGTVLRDETGSKQAAGRFLEQESMVAVPFDRRILDHEKCGVRCDGSEVAVAQKTDIGEMETGRVPSPDSGPVVADLGIHDRQLGDVEETLLPGGEAAGRITDISTVAELVERIMREAEETLEALGKCSSQG